MPNPYLIVEEKNLTRKKWSEEFVKERQRSLEKWVLKMKKTMDEKPRVPRNMMCSRNWKHFSLAQGKTGELSKGLIRVVS